MALTRIGATGAHVASGAVTFTIPAEARTGDLLVALLSEHNAYPTSIPTPKGWARLANEGASNRGGTAYAKLATAEDAGSTVSFASTSTLRNAGGLVVYRNAETPSPIAADADAFRVVVNTSTTTNHVALPTVGYQADDVRLLLWTLHPATPNALTPPATAGYTTLVNQQYILLGEYLANTPGTSGGLTAVSQFTAQSNIVSATLHARPLARLQGLAAEHNGHIGLVE